MRSILIITVVMVVVILIAIVIATIEIAMKSPGAHLLRGPWDWCLACCGTDQERVDFWGSMGIQNPGRTLLFCVVWVIGSHCYHLLSIHSIVIS